MCPSNSKWKGEESKRLRRGEVEVYYFELKKIPTTPKSKISASGSVFTNRYLKLKSEIGDAWRYTNPWFQLQMVCMAFFLLFFEICDFSLWFWDEWSKSLVKATRTRIEVVRRRAESKQRFWKEDLAKLLDNGLDINAYGRVSVSIQIQFWFDEYC